MRSRFWQGAVPVLLTPPPPLQVDVVSPATNQGDTEGCPYALKATFLSPV